jgi:hypothetical protein
MLVAAACVAMLATASDLPESAVADAGIRRTLAAMEAAASRADSGAYMALVDPSDPVFAEEQRKWARDLRVRPAASVRFTPEGDPLPDADGRWTVPLAIEWTLPGEAEARAVRFDAAFRPVGLDTGAWVYAGRVWSEHPADGVRLLFAAGDVDAAEMADYLATRVGELRASVEAELDERLPADPVIKIYPDVRSLQASIALSYTDPLGGWNEPGESIKLLGRPGMVGPRLDATVAHEIGHAVSFEYGPDIIRAPWWALEGIAEVAADPFRERPRDGAARALAEQGGTMPFDRLADFRGEAMNHGRQVYVQGRSMLAYIGERWGEPARNDWLRAMGRGASLEDATGSVLGVGFGELEAAWNAWVRAREASTPG